MKAIDIYININDLFILIYGKYGIFQKIIKVKHIYDYAKDSSRLILA